MLFEDFRLEALVHLFSRDIRNTAKFLQNLFLHNKCTNIIVFFSLYLNKISLKLCLSFRIQNIYNHVLKSFITNSTLLAIRIF